MKYHVYTIEVMDVALDFEKEVTEFTNKLLEKNVRREDINIEYKINDVKELGTFYYAIISWWE